MRILIGLRCGECQRQNYVVSKNKTKKTEALKLKKYCRFCKKHTVHQESKKLD